jgi:tRNA 5-methylaminomethyl-2-thiouridine biosynthesis bifunctional protein
MPETDVLQIPSAGWASPELICDAIRKACGDRLSYVQANISSLDQLESVKGKNWRLMSEGQDVLFETELLVLANGIHATEFMQTDWMPVRSARGQLTRLKLQSGVVAPECAFSAGHYISPSLNNDSVYYCGASYHLDDGCTELRESDQNTNWAFAEQCCPGSFQRPQTLDGRTGFRAVSDDRMPVVGPVPDATWFETEYGDLKHGRPVQSYADACYLQGLYVTAAHGSRGMTSCFLAAEIIAAQIETTPLPVDQHMIETISPARFIVRRLKRGA